MAAKKTIIAFQGLPGAYSYAAARAWAPKLTPRGYPTFEEAADAVRNGSAAYAILPIENSTTGRVADIHHVLHANDLHIVGEHFQPVRHCLITHKTASLSDIKSVYSHREALGQCKGFLRTRNLEAVPFGDTAGAVEYVSQQGRKDIAALASEESLRVYPHVKALLKNVQDIPDNVTRFIIVQKGTPKKNPGDGITSIIYETRDIPAALYKTLTGFATAGVQVIKLESFVPMTRHRDAHFYLEFEGSPDNYPHSVAMQELGHYAKNVRILGVYRKSPYRRHFEAPVDNRG